MKMFFGAGHCLQHLQYIPLFLFGIITGQILLMFFASVVILVDVFRLTNFITEIAGFGESLPVQFVVLGISGLALGFLGYLISKKQSQYQNAFSAWAESKLGNWVISSDEEDDGNNDEKDGNA